MSTSTNWAEISKQAQQPRKGGQTDVVFINSKSVPQVFLPSPQVLEYLSVYDDETKKNRPPDSGEKGKLTYLFYGLNINEKNEKVVKIYSCGKMVADGIAMVQESLKNLGLISFVKVSATGTGLETKYSVVAEKVVEKPIPQDIWVKLQDQIEKLPKLEELRDKLLGLVKKEDAPAVTGAKLDNALDL